jgi:putative two-component system response regulator
MVENSRILVVDDVVDNIRVILNILKQHSYEYSFAQNGTEALRLVFQQAEQFDLILLDVMMPGLNGYDVCKALKENPITKDIPIVFVTAKADVEAIAKGFELGAVDYIAKPFHASELLARVKTHVELYRAKQVLVKYNIDLQTKSQYEAQRLLTELENNQKEMIFVLTEFMEVTSDETGKHIKRIADSSAALAKHYPSLNKEDVEILYHASPMHDIGKMAVPLEILNKPGRYTEEEFTIMKRHTTVAFELLAKSELKLVKAAAIIAHEHHEKWDGTGYPRGLRADQIHIYGRIVALVDVFDALTHKRQYKDAWSVDDTVNYIIANRESHFDPDLVDIFVAHLDEFVDIAKLH